LPTPPFWLAQAMIWPTQAPNAVVGKVKFYHSGPFHGSDEPGRDASRPPPCGFVLAVKAVGGP
jgi:hypothetical protein